MKPHILNFYEDDDLLLSDVDVLITSSLTGKLFAVKEKLDGQNFTFTVIDGEVRFLGKGIIKTLARKGGLNRAALMKRYHTKPDVQSAFIKAYDFLQFAVKESSIHPVNIFENGKYAILAEVLCNETVNIVTYKNNYVCPIKLIGTETDYVCQKRNAKFYDFCWQSEDLENDGWIFKEVPTLEFVKENVDSKITECRYDFKSLMREFCDDDDLTMGDLKTRMVKSYLGLEHTLGIEPRVAEAAARRIATKDKRIFTHKMAGVSKEQWKAFQGIEKTRTLVMSESINKLVSFFQKLGSYVISLYALELAKPDNVRVSELQDSVMAVKEALVTGRIGAQTHVIDQIETALKRIPDVTKYTSNAEGIVFNWDGEPRKFTGYFTAINHLNGFFEYGGATLIGEQYGR